MVNPEMAGLELGDLWGPFQLTQWVLPGWDGGSGEKLGAFHIHGNLAQPRPGAAPGVREPQQSIPGDVTSSPFRKLSLFFFPLSLINRSFYFPDSKL